MSSLHLLYGYLFLELLLVGIIDYKTKKISNIWSIIHVAIFVLSFAFVDFYSWSNLFYPLIVLLISFGLFLCRAMGAGDGKYLATFILVVPNKNSQIIFLIYLMIVIIAATLPSVIYAIRYKEKFEKKPFAPIILIAWTLYVLTIMAKAW